MRLVGDLVLAGLGQIKNARIDNVASDPATPSLGQVWYNTTDGKYRGYNGVDTITFADASNIAQLQAEMDATQIAAGFDASGNYVAHTVSNFLGSATSVPSALSALDTQIKTTADTAASNLALVQTELNATQTGAGLNADGTYAAAAGTNYIGSATSLTSADALLDGQIKTNADSISQNATDIATKVAKAGDSMGGNLAFGGAHRVVGLADPQVGSDAATKNYVDNVAVGLSWKEAVHSSGTALPATAARGNRFLNLTDSRIYEAIEVDTWDAGLPPKDGDSVFDKTDETGYVYTGTAWTQFTGLGQVTAGVGLYKAGNQMHINLGAGIGQLPTDEVGVDVYANGGLFLTADGSTSSTDGAAQLSLRLDGTTMSLSSTGVKVATGGITSTELAASIIGNGLSGAAGAALTVVAGMGIVVDASGVSMDATYNDGRYINTAGDTMTGDFTLAADPTTALMAATKQYVDSVRTALEASTFVFDSGVTSATTHVVTHNIGSKFCNVTVVDSADKVIIPDSITFDTVGQLTVGFASAVACRVIVTGKKV